MLFSLSLLIFLKAAASAWKDGLAAGWVAGGVVGWVVGWVAWYLEACSVVACSRVADGGSNHNYDSPTMTHGALCLRSSTRTRRSRQ